MLGGPEGIVLLVLVLVLFGGSQLPKLARNLGKAQQEFRDALDDGKRAAADDRPNQTSATTEATPSDAAGDTAR